MSWVAGLAGMVHVGGRARAQLFQLSALGGLATVRFGCPVTLGSLQMSLVASLVTGLSPNQSIRQCWGVISVFANHPAGAGKYSRGSSQHVTRKCSELIGWRARSVACFC